MRINSHMSLTLTFISSHILYNLCQVMSTFKYARADVIDRFRPELDAILQSLIWSFSVAVNAPSPGDQLQNVRYLSDHTCTGSSAVPNQFFRVT